ncbi:TonB-dependent receptor [bacterium]|nr:TonB-dependent receptor [candidate division CSSED10-310 bacterium]
MNRSMISVFSIILCFWTQAAEAQTGALEGSIRDDGASDIQDVMQATELALDVKSATSQTVLDRQFTERLPNSGEFLYSLSIPGSVTKSGNIHILGSAKVDTIFLYDGIDVTDPLTSLYGADITAENLDTIVIQKSGIKAEYGRALGGIVHMNSRTPGNEFHGLIRIDYVDEDWHSDYDMPWAQETYQYWKYTATLEGPILKDKLWFLVSYYTDTIDSEASVIAFYGADPDQASSYRKIPTDRTDQLPMLELVFQPYSAHRITFRLGGNMFESDNRYHDPFYALPETGLKQETGGQYYGLEWRWLVNDRLSFLTKAGMYAGYLDMVPQNGDRSSPSFYDMYFGQSYNAADSWTEEDRTRLQLSVTADYLVDDLAGEHRFRAGLERQMPEDEQSYGIPGGGRYFINNDPDDPDAWMEAERTVPLYSGSATLSGDIWALFVQDDWQILDNVTLNIGLRYEKATYENDDGSSSVPAWKWGEFHASSYLNSDGTHKRFADMKFDNMLAPRLGVAWDIPGDNIGVLKAFWGRYYSPFNLALPAMFQPFSADPYAMRYQFYQGPQWRDSDRDGIPDEEFFFDDANWRDAYTDEPGDWNLLDPDIEPEYTDELTLGYEHELADNLIAGLTYTYRKTCNMIEDAGLFTDEDGNVIWTYRGGVKDDFSGLDPNKKYDPRYGEDYYKHLYYVTNANGAKREYNGLELSLNGRWDHYDAMASYTFSKAEGSLTDTASGDSGVAQFSGQYDTYATSQNLFGELPWSARHSIKLAGSTHWDITDWYGISFGVNGFWNSGFHYSKRTTPPATFDPDDPSNDPADPGTWTGHPPYRSYAWYYPEGRGTYELPGLSLWDVSLQNRFKFGKWGALTVIFDVENLFDHQHIISESDVYNAHRPEMFGQANAWTTPRTWRLSFRYAF